MSAAGDVGRSYFRSRSLAFFSDIAIARCAKVAKISITNANEGDRLAGSHDGFSDPSERSNNGNATVGDTGCADGGVRLRRLARDVGGRRLWCWHQQASAWRHLHQCPEREHE